jgi:WD40 repeat protein
MLVLEGQTARIWSLAFAPNGRDLVSATHGPAPLCLWRLPRRSRVILVKEKADPVVAFAPGGAVLASLDRQHLRCWDARTWDERFRHEIRSPSWACLGFSADGGTVRVAHAVWAGAGAQLSLAEWDSATGCERGSARCRLRHQAAHLAFVPSPAGLVAAGDFAGKVALWGPPARPRLLPLPEGTNTWRMAFGPDGRTLLTGGERAMRLWSLEPRRLRCVCTEKRAVHALAFSPDGRTLALGGVAGTVSLWDAVTGRLRLTLDPGIGPVTALAFAPDGMTAAAGGQSGKLAVWDVEDH